MNERLESIRQSLYEQAAGRDVNPPCGNCGHDLDDHTTEIMAGSMGCDDLQCSCIEYILPREDEPPEPDYYEGRY